jgi:hypothetical protein
MESNLPRVFGMTNQAGDFSSLLPRTGVPGGGRADFKNSPPSSVSVSIPGDEDENGILNPI